MAVSSQHPTIPNQIRLILLSSLSLFQQLPRIMSYSLANSFDAHAE
jgi:hypothetical protein